jgi:hypothetical protein
MQDLLAMTALQLASKGGKSSNNTASIDLSPIEDKLQSLIDELKD